MALNRNCVGKTYPEVTTEISLEAAQKYARACNDDNPRYFDPNVPGGILAPPMFGVVLTWFALLSATGDPEVGVDVTRLLHGEQDMEFLRPLRPGDRIVAGSRIASIDTRATGETMTVELLARNQQGVLVQRQLFGIFIRGSRRRDAAPRTRGDEGADEQVRAHAEPAVIVTQQVDPNQAARYAEASGDCNPIHLDERVARMFGLPGVILHGMCTASFVARATVNRLCGGDPDRLRRLRVRFSHPVLPGDSMTTEFWPAGEREGRLVYGFQTHASSGTAVVKDGLAEVVP